MFTIASGHRTLTLDEQTHAFHVRLNHVCFSTAPLPYALGEIVHHEAQNTLAYTLPELHATVQWQAVPAGFRLTLSFAPDTPLPLEYPGNFLTRPGDDLILPIGEGLSFRVDDATTPVLPASALLGSCERNLRLAAILRQQAYLACAPDGHNEVLQENPRQHGLLQSHLKWLPCTAGRRVAMTLLCDHQGGLAKMAGDYRTLRDQDPDGPVATLKDKLRDVPNLAKLAGAPSFWLWHDHYEHLMYADTVADIDVGNADAIRKLAQELRQHGIDHALLNVFFGQDMTVARDIARDTGFLTGKYDNLQDELPGDIAHLIPEPRIRQCDYTDRLRHNWPDDIVLMPNGQPAITWALRGTDGIMHPQHLLCPSFAPQMIRQYAIPLAQKHGLTAWFLDVLGCGDCACHHPAHPLASSIRIRNEALRELNRAGIISGTEEGVEAYIGSYCYCEGRLSPRQYRINYQESGRKKAHLYTPDEYEQPFTSVMLNPARRVPLWELIYHDCAVAYWYWGDSSNSCPDLLRRRDLFNVLYGTPPLFSLHNSDWPQLQDAILRSCREATQTARDTMFARMTHFDYLADDRSVQQTSFDNGVSVIVDFNQGTATRND